MIQKDAIIRGKIEVAKDASVRELLADAWDEGSRAGWGDRTLSLVESRTYDEELAKATPNPYRSTAMITDQIVEAAAKAVFNVQPIMNYWATWDELPQEGRDAYELMAEIALRSALPKILAEERAAAWGLGMWTMYNTTSSEYPPVPEQNPFRSEA